MGWNDPGKNENPWQRRPGQGPPDLDEVVRRMQKRLRALFGGGSPPGPAGEGGGRGLAFLLVAALVVWFALGGWYVNEAAERAVITRFGKYVKTTTGGFNLRLPWPIDQRTVVNVTEFATYADRTRMLTQDQSLVDIELAVQYRRTDPVNFAFGVRAPEETLGEVSESAIREIVGQSGLAAVLGPGRREIGVKTKDLVQRTITAYNTGIEVMSVNLTAVAVPEQVEPAQNDASKAVQDKERAILAAQTYANDIVPKARGAAVSVVEGARAYRSRVIAESEGETRRFLALAAEYQRAPAVTRQRLYLETMEQVLKSSSKVIVDTEGTGNMVYLPLDKLLEQRTLQRPPAADSGAAVRPEDGVTVVAPDPRARRDR